MPCKAFPCNLAYKSYNLTMEEEKKVKLNTRQTMLVNFLGGIAWGLGATFGVSFVIAFFGLILKQINLVPTVGTFASQVTTFVLQNNPHLLK
jgi:hypothetical protein